MTDNKNARWTIPALIATGLGLGMSLLLLWEYLAPGAASGLCATGGGCDAVRASRYAAVFGIPTPVFGIAYFAAVLIAAILRWRRLIALVAAGAAVAVGLLLLQALVIGAFCKLCLITDGCALALPVLFALARREPPLVRTARVMAIACTVAVAAGPVLAAVMARGEEVASAGEMVAKLPPVVAREQVPGKVTIVEFIDFQCPYCRKLYAELQDILPAYGDKVRVVRHNAPLPFHEHAEYAARAAICAEGTGHEEAMAHALFTADSLAPPIALSLAKGLGMEADVMALCIPSEKTTAALKTDLEEAKAAGIEGLPTFYIGHQKFIGVQPPEVVRAAIDRALERR